MAEHDQEQKLEELLDSMLAVYSAAEPRPGLETRILANLRAQAGVRAESAWSRWWLWAGAGVAAAVVALVFAALRHPVQRVDPSPQATVKSAPQVPQRPASPGSPKRESTKAATSPRHQRPTEQLADLRPDVFPTPAPLSEQEKLLLRYLAGTPREEIIAQSHVDEPPQEALPDNQTALPGTTVNNSQLSNTR